jgi:hypothetical protein
LIEDFQVSLKIKISNKNNSPSQLPFLDYFQRSETKTMQMITNQVTDKFLFVHNLYFCQLHFLLISFTLEGKRYKTVFSSLFLENLAKVTETIFYNVT